MGSGGVTYSMGQIQILHAPRWEHCFKRLGLGIPAQAVTLGGCVTCDRPLSLSKPQFPHLKLGGFTCLTMDLGGHDEGANAKGLCCAHVRDY